MEHAAPGAVNEAPPTPPPARAHSRSSPGAVHLRRRPLLHGVAAAARPLLSTTPVPEAPAPPPRAFKLKTSREAAPESRDRAPPPEVRWPSRDLGRAPPLGRAGSAPRTQLLTPREGFGAQWPSPAAAVPAPCGTDPGIQGQEGLFPRTGFSSCPTRAQRGRPRGWEGQHCLPAGGQAVPVWLVHAGPGQPPPPLNPPHAGSHPESFFYPAVTGVKWANPVAPCL